MGVGIQVALVQIKEYYTYLQLGYQFEVTDFAYPSNYGIKGEKILQRWQVFPQQSNIASTHGSYYDLRLHSIDPQIKEITRKRYLWNLAMSDKLRAEYTIFHTNYQPSLHSDHYQRRWTDDHLQFQRRYAEEYDTTMLWENVFDTTPRVLQSLLKEDPDTGVCLDLGYLQLHSEVGFEEWFEQLGPAIKVIHLKEQIREGEELPLGTGYLDWDDIAEDIAIYCDDPVLILEMDGMENITASLEYIGEHGLFGT